MKGTSFFSWAMLAAAFLLWGAVGFAIVQVTDQKEAHKTLLASAQEREIKDSSLSKLKAALNETKAQRAAFAASIPPDVISIVEHLDSAAAAAGVQIEISNAQPLGNPNERAGTTGVAFVIKTEGTFAQMMRMGELLGSLPIPSGLEQYDLVYDEGNKKWQLSARIRFLTAANSSS